MLKGTDVSAWQSTTVPRADFCIVKLTQGTGYENEKAADQIRSAREQGQLVGYYHFPEFKQDAKANCDHFVRVLRRFYRVGDSVWYDNETYPEPPANQVNAWNKVFMSELDKQLDVTPGVYSNLSWARTRCEGLGKYPWWKAWPDSTPPDFSGYGVFKKAVMHQYLGSSQDWNYFDGTREDWLRMWTPEHGPTEKETDSMYGGYVPPNSARAISHPHGALKIIGLVNPTDTVCEVTIEVNHKTKGTTESKTLYVGGPRLPKGGWHKVTYSFKDAADADSFVIINHGSTEIGWDAS